MRYLSVVFLLCSHICLGNTLFLEFAQEGEPTIPRAVIFIHNAFESRDNLGPLLNSWGSRSWARDQYCSFYVYEYDQNGVFDLPLPENLAKDLYGRIRSGDFDDGRPDDINPLRRTQPAADERQPDPTTRGDVQLIFVGSGYGGLVARETARLARLDQRRVLRVVYMGSPLDGLSAIDLVLGLTTDERATKLGLSRALGAADFGRISEAWWHLVALHDSWLGWPSYFARVHDEALGVAAYGSTRLAYHPTDNVLYGRNRKLATDEQATDGFVPQPEAWGKNNGPIPWAKETVLQSTPQAELSERSAEFLLAEAVEQQITHGYLVRRQVIEESIKGDGEMPPIGVYWDEREPGQWREAYASRKGLYEMMWGIL